VAQALRRIRAHIAVVVALLLLLPFKR